ncbi:sensor histidine kinase [Cupriavidus agavae]|uniref:histidine kinase n=1 Tax=Cupriavidus agavae TaxID=1001822 RepID=A0A4Q7RZ34_9BURK|nr:HAMP domain-containing sensor histidine kinase [Cupriavidus agavae]RZT39134.1 two-component system CAI-1 autoinducer sensor kinase/phosphatase CqsS [Cupriavidus agavae]
MEATQEQARSESVVGRLARESWRAIFETASRTTLLDEESVMRLRRIQMVGALGVIGHPLYFVIWSYIFPQPYENIWLRLVCTALFVPLLFASSLSHKRWLPAYALFAITVGMPFAFIFFYLENHASLVWAESVIIAVVVLYHFNSAFATIALVAGAAGAFGLFAVAGHSMAGIPWDSLLLQIPILAFVIAVLVVIKLDRQLMIEQKRRGMAVALATVAHELRTPLTSLTMTANALKGRLPTALDPASPQRDGLLQAIGRLQADLAHVNSSIELLVANSKDPHSARQELFEVGRTLHDSIERFPFEPAYQDVVKIEVVEPALVMGNAQLFELVITNLTKNALEAIKRAGKGDIRIRCDIRADGIHVLFRDTGPGVPPQVLARMFQPFFSYPAHRGTGIGLAFCRDVLRSWEASISCQSVEHEFTEFDLAFPHPKG